LQKPTLVTGARPELRHAACLLARQPRSVHYSKFEKDGVTRYATEIIAEDVQFLTRAKPENDRESAPEVD